MISRKLTLDKAVFVSPFGKAHWSITVETINEVGGSVARDNLVAAEDEIAEQFFSQIITGGV